MVLIFSSSTIRESQNRSLVISTADESISTPYRECSIACRFSSYTDRSVSSPAKNGVRIERAFTISFIIPTGNAPEPTAGSTTLIEQSSRSSSA